jgi:hypothetical protein
VRWLRVITGFERADAIASLIVVALILHAAWGLLRETGRILLDAAPEGYAPGEITTAITRQPAVASVHDVHVWLITAASRPRPRLFWSGPRPAVTGSAVSWSSSCATGSPSTCRPITPRMTC